MRKFLLLVFLFFFSVSAFAQIRIEKRHYNKGWYVSLNRKKKSGDEKTAVKSVSEQKMQAEPVFITEEKTLAGSQAVSENENIPAVSNPKEENQQKQVKPISVEKMKYVAAPAAQQIKTVVAAPVKMQQPFTRNAKRGTVLKADPGDSLFEYLFDGFVKAFLWVLIIVAGILLLVYLLSFLISESALLTVVGILSLAFLVFCAV